MRNIPWKLIQATLLIASAALYGSEINTAPIALTILALIALAFRPDGQITLSPNASLSFRKWAEEAENFDVLTGLPSRTFASKQVAADISERAVVSIVLCDVCGLGKINVKYGNLAGDFYLRTMGVRLTDCIPSSKSFVARSQGDQFVCIFPGTTLAEAKEKIPEMQERCEEPVFWEEDGAMHPISRKLAFSAASSEEGGGFERMLETSMRSLKEEKRRISSRASKEKEQTLLDAMRLNRLELHYQEIRAAKILCPPSSWPVVAYEALARLRQDDGTLLMPGEFVEDFQELDLMKPFTQWVVREATKALDYLPPDVSISVNVPPSLSPVDLADIWCEIKSPRLVVEITEDAIYSQASVESYKALKARGVNLMVDDLGTGFSSIMSVESLRPFGAKIDRSFKTSPNVVAGMVDLIHRLGAIAVLEGIEEGDEEILSAAVSAGCDRFQGWMWGKAKPLESLHDRPSASPSA